MQYRWVRNKIMNIEISPVEYERTLNWSDANMYCQLLEIDGKMDWRLPTEEEFKDIHQSYYTITLIKDGAELRPVKRISKFYSNFYYCTSKKNSKAYFFMMYTGESRECPDLNNKFCIRPVRTV